MPPRIFEVKGVPARCSSSAMRGPTAPAFWLVRDLLADNGSQITVEGQHELLDISAGLITAE